MTTFLTALVIKASIILALALLARRFLGRYSAATRHWILLSGIIGVALTPVWTLALPSWSMAAPVRLPDTFLTSGSGPAGDTAVQAFQAAAPRRRIPAAQIVGAIWLTGFLWTLSTLAIGTIRLARIASRAAPVDGGAWDRQSTEVARLYGLRRSVRLLQSHTTPILVTWGALRPKVLLPSDSQEWPEDRIRAVLCHELAHIRRSDWLSQIGAELIRAFFWFNPLMWIVCARLRLESEYACDNAALVQGFSGSDYSAHLLDVVQALRRNSTTCSAALAMARPSTLERRFSAVLNSRTDRHPLSRSAMLVIALAVFAFTLPLAALTSTVPAETVSAPTAVEVKAAALLQPVPETVLSAGPPRPTPRRSQAPVSPAVQQAPQPAGGTPFVGEPITLMLTNMDLREFFGVIGTIGGLSIDVDPSVRGSVTILAKNLPWDQVLDVVLRNNNLVAQQQGNLLSIRTNQNAAQDQITLQFDFLKNATLVAAPRISLSLPNGGASVTQDGLSITVTGTSRAADGNISTVVAVALPGSTNADMQFKLIISQDKPGIIRLTTNSLAGADSYELRVTLISKP